MSRTRGGFWLIPRSMEWLESRLLLTGQTVFPGSNETRLGVATDLEGVLISDDGATQVISEVGGRVIHTWRFDIPANSGISVTFEAEVDSTDEVFWLSYSTDGSQFDTFATVTAQRQLQTIELPITSSGQLYVQAQDSIREFDATENQLSVDFLFAELAQAAVNDEPTEEPEIVTIPPTTTPPTAKAPDLENQSMLDVTQPTSPMRLLIMGDSITSGINERNAAQREIPPRLSYRHELWDLISDRFGDDYVEYVGTTEYNSAELPEQAKPHASYRGFASYSFFPHPSPTVGSDPFGAINGNAQDANGWATLNPDIAIIMIGTNDVSSNRFITDNPKYPTYGSLQRTTRRIITQLRATQPNVTVLLGTLPPYIGETRIDEANDMIRDLVNPDPSKDWSGTTISSPIVLVDHHQGENGNPPFSLDLHLVDSGHPNELGDELLAANWWWALEPLLAAGPAPRSLPVVTIDTTEVIITEDADSPGHVTVRRGGDLTESLTVHFATSGSASLGADYVIQDSMVIPAGQADGMIEISVRDDNNVEPTETIELQLLPDRAYQLGPNMITISIADDDELNTVSVIARESIVDESEPAAEFTFTRLGDLSAELRIDAHFSGSATEGEDYIAPPRDIVIQSGSATTTFVVPILDDEHVEPTEAIQVAIQESDAYLLGPNTSAEVSLTDNDNLIPNVAVYSPNPIIMESGHGIVAFMFSRQGSVNNDLPINIALSGTATLGNDYLVEAENFMIPAGQSSARLHVQLLDDELVERIESIEIRLLPSSSYIRTTDRASVQIHDNDSRSSIASLLALLFANHDRERASV